MPELPEVETTILNLRIKVRFRTFIDIWTDFKNIVKKPSSFEEFRKLIKNKKILRIWRAGKNIIFELSGGLSLLVHQKLTGHLIYGIWGLQSGKWKSKISGPLEDKVNSYIHLIFWLDDGKMLALSDLRKFAKVELWKTKKLKESEEIKNLGPDPLKISSAEFKNCFKNKKGKIKHLLMDQGIVSGIGNIYSDEILFKARIHPFREIKKLTNEEIERIYQTTKKILKKAIKLKGTSVSDYRLPAGGKGEFEKILKVYRREGEKCSRCGTIIKRVKLAGRSAHFCPKCQV